jgi:hypothetical protein
MILKQKQNKTKKKKITNVPCDCTLAFTNVPCHATLGNLNFFYLFFFFYSFVLIKILIHLTILIHFPNKISNIINDYMVNDSLP